MTEMPVRARRRLEDVAVNWQERRTRTDDARQQQADIRRRRMTCSDRLPTFHQTQDWTGSMGTSPSGRFSVPAETTAKQRLVTPEGIRWDVAWSVIIAVCVLLAAVLLADVAGIGRSARMIGKLNSRIEMVGEKNESMEASLAMSSNDISVCTEAVKLNLISSGGAPSIRLNAPANATLMLTQASALQSNNSNSNTVGD